MDEAKQRGMERHWARLRAATPDERLQAAAAQRRIGLELLRGGLRARFPHLSDAELEDRMGEILFGAEVWRGFRERRRMGGSGAGSP